MTVEALLKQLEDERMRARGLSFIYGAEAIDAGLDEETDNEKQYRELADQNFYLAEHLTMVINEIRRRVS